MATVELPCTVADCTYKTPALPHEFAFRQMDTHRADTHNTAAVVPPTPTTTTPAAPRPEKVQRPCLDVDMTTEKWQYLNTRWISFKNATRLTGESITIQLLEACNENLRFSMFQSDSQINQKSEADILALMKTLSVKEESIMVTRMNFDALHQGAGESISNFVARLKGQAELCRYRVKCHHADCTEFIRYTNEMIRDNMVRHLYDQDIQREILGQQDQEMELEQLIKLIEAKEAGKRTQADLLGNTAAAMSSYKRDRRNDKMKYNNNRNNSNNDHHNENTSNDSNNQAKCGYCGEIGHGRNNGPGRLSLQHRREKCPAFSTTCSTCTRKGHFTAMCRQQSSRRPPGTVAGAAQRVSTDGADETGAVESFSSAFDEMCAVSDMSDPASMLHDEPADVTASMADVTPSPSKPQHDPSEPSPAAASGVDPILEAEAGLVSLTNSSPAISIDTQQYDRLKGWINRPPSSHPTVNLDAHVDASDYEHFGYKFTSPPRSATIPVVTDTGCMLSLIHI